MERVEHVQLNDPGTEYQASSSYKDDPTLGRKYDTGKPMMELLPPNFLLEVAKVLTVGAQKYARHNWSFVENGKARYYGALQRHLNSYAQGELYDEETGLPHLAHAACCLAFLFELEHTLAEAQLNKEEPLPYF